MLFFKKHADILAGVIILVFFVVSLIVSAQESTTMDERAHIPSAYSYVRYGDMRLNPEHPPLLKDLAGLPLLFLQPAFPTNIPAWLTGTNEQWVMGDTFLHLIGNDAQQITFWSRFPILLIAVGLGLALYLWTRHFLGSLAGLFALTLYAFDPNILGHNHLVTTDLGIAAFVFFSTIAFIRWVKNPTLSNTLLFGVMLGLVQLAKYSAVTLFPLYILLAIIYALARTDDRLASDPSRAWRYRIGFIWEYIWKYALAVIVCFIAIEILYFFNTMNMPAEKIIEISDSVFKADNTAAHIARTTVNWMASIPVLKPMSEYFLGLFMVFARVAGGNTYYFFGTVSNHATPFYFPAVFILKETLPLLALILASLIYGLVRFVQSFRDQSLSCGQRLSTYIEQHFAMITMLTFVIFYSYLSITSNLNIGFRHLFPILPFIYILVTKVIWDACHAFHQHMQSPQPIVAVLIGLFVFWIVAIPVLAYPSYISYFNTAAGGHENGYRYATDSNYDWGQDLSRLRQWVDEYNSCMDRPSHFCSRNLNLLVDEYPTSTKIDTLRIDYFGGSSPEYYFGDMFKPWHGELAPEPGWYAISAGFFQESSHKKLNPGEWSYRWLNDYPMVARAGDSIFIYYVSPESLGQQASTPVSLNPGPTEQAQKNNEEASSPQTNTEKKQCVISGCNRELCTEFGSENNLTVCEAIPEYICYQNAACEKQADGACGWTMTSTLTQCLKEKSSLPSVAQPS